MPDSLDLVFSALANPARRQMLQQLQQGPATVNELAAPSGLTQPTVSAHLKVLEKAGLVSRSAEAQRRPVALNAAALATAHAWTGDYRKFWEGGLARLEAHARSLQSRESDHD